MEVHPASYQILTFLSYQSDMVTKRCLQSLLQTVYPPKGMAGAVTPADQFDRQLM